MGPDRRFAVLVAAPGLSLAALETGGCRRFQARGAEAGGRCRTIDAGGRTRRYFVHVPPSYDGMTPLPPALVLHGATLPKAWNVDPG
jgi:poly(3-hydroxybutyrate) depolymerase